MRRFGWVSPRRDAHMGRARSGEAHCLQERAARHRNARTNERTPYLFNVNCLPFDYDAQAPAPKLWLQFLEQLSPSNKAAKWTLRRMFGLLLTGDTSYQKIFVIIGPKRAGKGVIGRILRALLGEDNVVNPTMGSLSGGVRGCGR